MAVPAVSAAEPVSCVEAAPSSPELAATAAVAEAAATNSAAAAGKSALLRSTTPSSDTACCQARTSHHKLNEVLTLCSWKRRGEVPAAAVSDPAHCRRQAAALQQPHGRGAAAGC